MLVIYWRERLLTSLRGVTRARVLSAKIRWRLIFKTPGHNRTKKYPALVEVFNEKQVAEYQ